MGAGAAHRRDDDGVRARQPFFLHQGQQVRAGDIIAEIGNRGESTSPHLHFEVWTPEGKKIDPLPWLAARGIHLG